MENLSLSVLVLDHDPVSMSIISSSLAKFNFKDPPSSSKDTWHVHGATIEVPLRPHYPQLTEAALDSLERGVAKDEELDLVLAEVHGNISVGTSALFDHILSKLEVPLITMCAYYNEEAVSECMVVGACLHVLKPLDAGTFNILKQKALEHRSARQETISRIDSLSTKGPKRRLESSNADGSETEEDEELEVWIPGYSKKSVRFMWSIELHEKFLQAVEVLRESASPGRIRRQMNVEDVTYQQIASHLQKHRLREQKAKEGGHDQLNTNMKQVPWACNLVTPENINQLTTTQIPITPRVASASRKACPQKLGAQAEKSSVEAATSKTNKHRTAIFRDDTKSVWDMYENSVQCQEILYSSFKPKQLPLKSRAATKDGYTANRPLNAGGGMGYDAAGSAPLENIGSNTFTSHHQLGENRCTEAAGSNGNLENVTLNEDTMNVTLSEDTMNVTLNEDTINEAYATAAMCDDLMDLGSIDLLADTNNYPAAETGLSDPFPCWEEVDSFWMAQMGGPQAQQELSPDDLLQVDDAWNLALQQEEGGLPNMDGAPTAQEPATGDAPAYDPALQFTIDDVLWTCSPLVTGDYAAPDQDGGN